MYIYPNRKMPARKKLIRRIRRRHVRRSKAVATKGYVRKMINKESETKYFDLGALATGITYAGSVADLTGVIQGNGDTNRIGDKLRMKHITLKYQLQQTTGPNMFRVIVFQYIGNTQISGAPGANTVLSGGTLSTANAPLAMYTWDYRNQYIILYDKLHCLNSQHPTIDVRKEISLRFAKKEIAYYSGTTAGANKIYMIMLSDVNASLPTMAYQYRLSYEDA